MLIQCKPCFAIDTLCALANRGRCYNSIPAVRRLVQEACKGQKIVPNAWALTLALMKECSFSDAEKLTLKGLREDYPRWMENSELLHSSVSGVRNALSFLEENGFEKVYEQYSLPYVQRWCQVLNERFFELDMSGVKANVKKLFPDSQSPEITVYLSYFLYPESFSLSKTTLVTSGKIGQKFHLIPMLRKIIHELLHGLWNKELIEEYLDVCRKDSYLGRCRWYLTNCLGALEEEEFVVALEHAVAVKNEIETLAEAKKALASESEGCSRLQYWFLTV